MIAILKLIRLLNYALGLTLMSLAIFDSGNSVLSGGDKLNYTTISLCIFVVIEIFFFFVGRAEENPREDDELLDN